MITRHLCKIDSGGSVEMVYRKGSQIEFYDGQEEDGYFFKYAPDGVDDLGAIMDEYYWDDEWKLRPVADIRLEGLVLKNVPAGSTIIIEDQTYFVEQEGDVTLSFEYAGEYLIVVKNHPYLTKEFTIDYQPQP